MCAAANLKKPRIKHDNTIALGMMANEMLNPDLPDLPIKRAELLDKFQPKKESTKFSSFIKQCVTLFAWSKRWAIVQ